MKFDFVYVFCDIFIFILFNSFYFYVFFQYIYIFFFYFFFFCVFLFIYAFSYFTISKFQSVHYSNLHFIIQKRITNFFLSHQPCWLFVAFGDSVSALTVTDVTEIHHLASFMGRIYTRRLGENQGQRRIDWLKSCYYMYAQDH